MGPHTGPPCSTHWNEVHATHQHTDFSAPASRTIATQPTRFVL
ncbi:hypothetical protein HMPREF1980_02449 [Actinomyces sp. oral taxon 172 str. F0311]|nr:hypothetical protein HMPREF1980_02449 [Actinomyces sp. oral taxon 172 str. F0311]